jgi:protein-S-isoprenylcysteine O-methyltransferase Ste14
MAATSDHAHVIAPPPLIAAAAALGGLGLRQLWPVRLWPWSNAAIPAGLCFAGALLLAGPALARMLLARTAIIPHHATTALVTTGPFRFTRNPLYLSFGFLLAGLALEVNSLAMAVMIAPWVIVMRRGVITREERYMEGKFGDEYRAYCRRVRRWL